MPEYLAPGVYIEEVDTGPKPIEGVSTSTVGLVGVAERGPVNVPVLVTSVGEYVRWFGGLLAADPYATYRYLPHAVQGFFTNGGKRAYVVRALDPAAREAEGLLFYDDGQEVPASALVRPAAEGTGSAAQPPSLVILPAAGLVPGNWIRIGDGSTAEYQLVASAPTAGTVLVPVALPLSRSHDAGTAIDELTPTVDKTFATASADDDGATSIGATSTVVSGATADVNGLVTALATAAAANTPATRPVVVIGAAPSGEYRYITDVTDVTVLSATDSSAKLHLDAALALPHPGGEIVASLTFAVNNTATVTLATAGSGLVFVDDTAGNFADPTHLVRISTDTTVELRRIGAFAELAIVPATDGFAGGEIVQAVQYKPDRTLSVDGTAGDTTLTLQPGETDGLAVGERIVLDPTVAPEPLVVVSVDEVAHTVTVTPELTATHSAPVALVVAPKHTTGAVSAGGRVLSLDDRVGLAEGDVVTVSLGATTQTVTVESIPALTLVAPDPGNVVIYPPLLAGAVSGAAVQLLGAPAPAAGRPATIVALPAVPGATSGYVSDGTSYAAGDVLRVTDPSGTATYYMLGAAAVPTTAQTLTLQYPLNRSHPVGSLVVQRTSLIDVQALDAGIWGNRLRISVEDESPGLVSNTTLASFSSATSIRLASAAGVQPGTILEFADATTAAVLGDPLKVVNINRQAQNEITLAGSGLAPAQQVVGATVRSREFRVTVRLLRQPDPSVPSRDSQVIDIETFRYLSLDPRHSNYVETVIGAVDGPLRKWDRRPEGSSVYIRVRDASDGTLAEQYSVRLGPELLVDSLPDGRTTPALQRLGEYQGDDAIGSISDDTFLGDDNADPELRTGLQSLRNIEEVSIVAVPGQTSGGVQQGVIDHCELMQYRFAVLDSLPEPADTLTDVQVQRQQFDSKYAALYYPWLTIADPFPTNLADIHDFPIPPAGHVLGVYARTDVTRGVHKAPANELVQGITGLRRKLNKADQDILNPYPVNINVIRDFRDNNLGIRVYGGRVITSDPDWKYVNVRRLMIFIEASLNQGLQWVVFEPNADPLWARVTRTTSDFLTGVWRSGALEGTKAEQAFFVKCDRTTMTQDDIDNGRLIVLVGVAPVKPAEFVIVRIGLWTANADS